MIIGFYKVRCQELTSVNARFLFGEVNSSTRYPGEEPKRGNGDINQVSAYRGVGVSARNSVQLQCQSNLETTIDTRLPAPRTTNAAPKTLIKAILLVCCFSPASLISGYVLENDLSFSETAAGRSKRYDPIPRQTTPPEIDTTISTVVQISPDARALWFPACPPSCPSKLEKRNRKLGEKR